MLTIYTFSKIEQADKFFEIINSQVKSQQLPDRMKELLGDRNVVQARNIVIDIQFNNKQIETKNKIVEIVKTI